jgi:sulfate/thiosulfate-binding protein
MRKRQLAGLLAPVLALVLAASGCSGARSASAGTEGSAKLDLVAYSTPEVVYQKLIPMFEKTPAGKGDTFTQSYGASGDQSRAVAAGQAADVVHFSLAPDIDRLVDAGIVPKSWDKNPYHGIVSDSVVVLAVRKGNPKGIHGWDDLVKSDIEVITPNPFTSGGARWNIMAAYGAELREGKSPKEAQQYLSDLFHHVPVQDDKASAALATFTGGKGDVLITYENEAILAQKSGADIDYIVPTNTILIQTPAAVTTTTESPAAAKAFLKFLYTPEAQATFAETGYRPVVKSVASKFSSEFPTPAGLFTIDDVGGWDTVMKTFFDPESSVMQRVEQSIGVSTGG